MSIKKQTIFEAIPQGDSFTIKNATSIGVYVTGDSDSFTVSCGTKGNGQSNVSGSLGKSNPFNVTYFGAGALADHVVTAVTGTAYVQYLV